MSCLVGPSGSGKTTLLHILGLIDTATKGSYKFNGKEITGLPESELTAMRAENIAFMFQENYLITHLTSLENVLLPIIQIRKLTASDRRKAITLLSEMGIGECINQRVSNLSGGQRQRVCIARAPMKSPQLIIADEPSASFDSATTISILHLFQSILEKHNCAMIISTHDITVIDFFSNSIIRIKDGRIIQ